MHDTLFRGAVVTRADILDDGWVAIDGERKIRVGAGEPSPARTALDPSGRTVLPGLVDGHMHTGTGRLLRRGVA